MRDARSAGMADAAVAIAASISVVPRSVTGSRVKAPDRSSHALWPTGERISNGTHSMGSSSIANREAAIAMEPGVRAFDDPATDAQAAAIRRPPPGQDRDGALGMETIAMGLRVVAAVALEGIRAAAGPAAHGRGRRATRRRADRVG
jgi:hypothetical protein